MSAKQNVYVVLFRGVGGATQLPTKLLREALATAGFGNVATYINSGNAIVSTSRSVEETTDKIAAVVAREFGFKKDIMVVGKAEWTKLMRENPFPEAVSAPTTLHAFVLADKPAKSAASALAERVVGRERVVVKGRILYFHAPDGFGASKLPPVVDRILGVPSTARNWNTVVRLMEMADVASAGI